MTGTCKQNDASISGNLAGFSAVCWLFAEYLYPHLNYPIGLIESSRGGTNIEAWSPPGTLTYDCVNRQKRSGTFLV
jgi:hypothetical protein